MKFIRILATGLLGAALVSGGAFAASDDDDDKSPPQREMYMKMAKERHEMSQDMMTMLRETMEIVRNLDDKPSAGEKEKLSKMIERMDGMMKRHDEMREEYRKKRDILVKGLVAAGLPDCGWT